MLEDNGHADLGPCCACEGVEDVNNIVMLDKKALVPGTGWGCMVCHLPNDGAVAVLCDACIDTHAEIRFVVVGYMTDHKRAKIEELTVEHKHNMQLHQDDVDYPFQSDDHYLDYEED